MDDGPDSLNIIIGLHLLIDHVHDLLTIGIDGYVIYLCSHLAEGLELPPVELNGSWTNIEGQQVGNPLEELHLLIRLSRISTAHKHLSFIH